MHWLSVLGFIAILGCSAAAPSAHDDAKQAFGVAEDDDNAMALKFPIQNDYISLSRSENHEMERAIEKFQKFTGLPVTRQLDKATIAQMKLSPRCNCGGDCGCGGNCGGNCGCGGGGHGPTPSTGGGGGGNAGGGFKLHCLLVKDGALLRD
ncbi:uncharacterized protein LOC144633372 [Oculina patagonica]